MGIRASLRRLGCLRVAEQTQVPRSRVQVKSSAPLNGAGSFVLYWMTSTRRTRYNYALQRALELARATGKPVVVLEALRLDYPWSSERLHTFVLEGMSENARDFKAARVSYLPYVERALGEGRGLLACLAADAAAIVTDDFPCFFMTRAQDAAVRKLETTAPRYFEAVDSNGVVPIRATDRVFTQARSFRIWRHKFAAAYEPPVAEPLRAYAQGFAKIKPALVSQLQERWGLSAKGTGVAPAANLNGLQFQLQVAKAPLRGGGDAARAALSSFVDAGLQDYGQARNHPDENGSSGLSPYLHFGHLSAHEILAQVTEAATDPALKPGVTAFVDQLLTWRELGFNFCAHRSDYDQLNSLPNWALATIAEHENDPRPVIYSLDQMRDAETHDELWNAAQRQLLTEGRMHNYLRMLWGKKIFEWSPSAQTALDTLIELNNAYALDGRDPNSYSGIFWIFGRYDRAWGPERPIFGKLRYMTSDSARRKLRLKGYLARFSG